MLKTRFSSRAAKHRLTLRRYWKICAHLRSLIVKPSHATTISHRSTIRVKSSNCLTKTIVICSCSVHIRRSDQTISSSVAATTVKCSTWSSSVSRSFRASRSLRTRKSASWVNPAWYSTVTNGRCRRSYAELRACSLTYFMLKMWVY